MDISAIKAACGRISAIDDSGQVIAGTVYLVSTATVATCAHVVESAVLSTIRINIAGASCKILGTPRIDREQDCALINLAGAPPGTSPLPLARGCSWKAPWDGYGFPAAACGAGLTLAGVVCDPNATDDTSAAVLELHCEEAASGMATPMSGWSGSPVVVKGLVVGHLKRVVGDTNDLARPAFGKVWATPSASVLRAMGHEALESAPSLEPQIAEEYEHQTLLQKLRIMLVHRAEKPAAEQDGLRLLVATSMIEMGEPREALSILEQAKPSSAQSALRERAKAVSEQLLSLAEEQFQHMPADHLPAESGTLLAYRLGPRNSLFVGRDDDLIAIASRLKVAAQATAVQVAAASGLGGVGKTQLANEFAYRYGQFFRGGVYWLSFADPANCAAEVAACGRAAGIYRNADTLTTAEQVRLTKEHWQSESPKLLIFDNCEDQALLREWLPRTGGCRVLVTSRRDRWDPRLGVNTYTLGQLRRDESIHLLVAYAEGLSPTDPSIGKIAAQLGDLPLALHLAGSFLRRYALRPQQYLKELGASPAVGHPSMRQTRVAGEMGLEKSFLLSFSSLNPDDSCDQLTHKLLAIIACLARGEPVPRSFADQLLAEQEEASNAYDRIDAIQRACELGLLKEGKDTSLTLHRLLAEFVNANTADYERIRESAVKSVALLLESANNSNRLDEPARLRLHLSAVAERCGLDASEDSEDLLYSLCLHFRMTGDYMNAFALIRMGARVAKRCHGKRHVSVARHLNQLGGVLQELGRHPTRALKVLLASRSILTSLPDDVRTSPYAIEYADCLNNLSRTLRDLNRMHEALDAAREALAIDERLGDLRVVARDLNGLARILSRLRRWEEALDHSQRALVLDEAQYGKTSLAVARDLGTLADAQRNLGRKSEAIADYKRALVISEAETGSRSARVASLLERIALTMRDDKDRDVLATTEVATYLRQAAAIFEGIHGPGFTHVAQLRHTLQSEERRLQRLSRATVERGDAQTFISEVP